MIVNPKYKFIFFKPMKVGGSSIEKSLYSYCDNNSLVTGGLSTTREKFEKILEEQGFDMADSLTEYEGINNDVYDEKSNGYFTLFHGHTTPKVFFDKIANKEYFQKFKKITVVRNPWDTLVSYYWYFIGNLSTDPKHENFTESAKLLENITPKPDDDDKKRKERFKLFTTVAVNPKSYSNFGEIKDTQLIADWLARHTESCTENIDEYMVYENDLNSEYKRVFQPIIKDGWLEDLPRAKGNYRSSRIHYSRYYDSQSRELIGRLNKQLIRQFNYKFET